MHRSSYFQLTGIHDMLQGNDSHSIRRRNALANSLTKMVMETNRRTVNNSVRSCLYAMAPSSLWQFYSGKGMTGSNKQSFADNLHVLSKAVILAVTDATKAEPSAIVKGISDVLKTMHCRKSAEDYRTGNPSEMQKVMGSDDKDVFGKKKRQ